MTGPAPDVIPQGGRFGPAIRFTPEALAAAAPPPAEGTGTCHACGNEAPLAGLEPTWFMGKARLVHAGASCLRPGGTTAGSTS